jgi:UPF0716 family protein affecting phage T7 exclusion
MTIGSSIGAGNTILLVVITAFIGSYLLRQHPEHLFFMELSPRT